MVPQTGTALLILFVFVLPGFATTLLRDRLYLTRAVSTDLERVLVSLAYSATIFGLTAAAVAATAPLTGFSNCTIGILWRGESPFAVYVGLAGWGLFFAPLAIAFAGFRWQNSRRREVVLNKLGVDPAHNTRSGWDHWFQQRERCLIIVTLTDGNKTAGLFDSHSMAGYTRDGQDLFLEKRWALDEDGWFAAEVEGAYGVWVPASQIAGLEIYRPAEDTDDAIDPYRRSRWQALESFYLGDSMKA